VQSTTSPATLAARKILLLRGFGTWGLLAISLRRSEARQKRHRGAGSAESKRHTAPMRDRPFSRMMEDRACRVTQRLERFFDAPCLAFRINIALVIYNAGESSSATHAAPTAVDACHCVAGLALEGRFKEECLNPCLYPASDQDRPHRSTFRTHRPVLRLGLGLIYPDLGIFALNAGFRTVDRPNTFCRVI
jgi:hypothetical protein